VSKSALALALLVLSSWPVYAGSNSMATLLDNGWRVIGVTREPKHKVCFEENQNEMSCGEENLEAATVFHLTKESGLAFCMGSYWWNGNSKNWTCLINKPVEGQN
jgi:hypothetical protein